MPGNIDDGLDVGLDQNPFAQPSDDSSGGTPPSIHTRYAIRLALMRLLKSLITAYAVPAINTALQYLEVPAGTTIPAFGDSSVIVGETSPKLEPIICITPGGFRNDKAGGMFNKVLVTNIKVKTVQIADNSPEDFTFFFNAIEDVLNDLFTNQATAVLQPINPATGNRMLPTGLAFRDCYLTDGTPMPYPGTGQDKVTRYQGWLFRHCAEINYGRLRLDALGM